MEQGKYYFDRSTLKKTFLGLKKKIFGSKPRKIIIKFIKKYFSNSESLFESGCGTGFALRKMEQSL